MKTFGFYFLMFFFLYLMCIFTLGVLGEMDFSIVFSIAYLIAMVLVYPFFLILKRVLAKI